MEDLEFKSFGKILHIGKLYMSITQKLHGSNAQILIEEIDCGDLGTNFHIKAGSRNRWLTIEDDNYGFCKWVMENQLDLYATLGPGRHYGEWCGPGINSGEGLKQKTLCLFNWRRWVGKQLPDQVTIVPVLYKGAISLDAVTNAMEQLKTEGSFLVSGFMKPEGVVVELDGQFYKNVFDLEEVKWNEKTKRVCDKQEMDVSHLLQPLRLEKLLSRDEKYIRDYPASISSICSGYVQDLEDEKQFKATNDDELRLEKKALGRQIYFFIKSIMSAYNE
jgi:hypothetical protein